MKPPSTGSWLCNSREPGQGTRGPPNRPLPCSSRQTQLLPKSGHPEAGPWAGWSGLTAGRGAAGPSVRKGSPPMQSITPAEAGLWEVQGKRQGGSPAGEEPSTFPSGTGSRGRGEAPDTLQAKKQRSAARLAGLCGERRPMNQEVVVPFHSGHLPGLQARSPGGRAGGSRRVILSHH
uniref:Uncharacterized protein n=1 Tax=Myotis myotis TaxID=51298 RepID=A0A7J7XHL4_MYOMY|nr:hypothetical protein mMyoMyo1_011588 [Myotis myotis]